MTPKIWYTGKNNYRKLTLELGDPTNHFTMEMIDVETQSFNNMIEIFAYHLEGANLPVEVLYSGGIDSECVMIGCLKNKIPVVAMTMRLMFRGCPVNTHDLYYSEKFCRENNVPQKFVDLDVEKFYTNGDHKKYLEPYYLRLNNVASHFWLIEQCSSFPIIGGDYTWPQLEIPARVYSPNRNEFAFYDVFMKDNGISGIGNMMSHSLEATVLFIKEHIRLYTEDPTNIGGDLIKIINLKKRMTESLGFGTIDMRHRSHGWEMLDFYKEWFNVVPYNKAFIEQYNYTTSSIKWNAILGNLLGVSPGENDSYGAGKL
jgi:hypothetical protein